MKKFSFTIIALLLVNLQIFSQTKAGTVHLKGTLKNFSEKVVIEDFSELQSLAPVPKERLIKADVTGQFDITFELSKPTYFRIGRNVLYLTPGDSMEVFLDLNDYLTSTFKGKGQEVNTYLLDTPFPKGGSFLNAGRNIRPTISETFLVIDSIASTKQKKLDALKEVSKEFIRLENARIKADMLNSYYRMTGYSYRLMETMTNAAKQAYKDSLDTFVKAKINYLAKGFVDASLMQLTVYRDIINVLDLEMPENRPSDIQRIDDWKAASNIASQINRESDKTRLADFKSAIDSIQTLDFRQALHLTLVQKMKFGKGDVAIDFMVKNSDGASTTLSSLKGKVIYVDVWATWCGPCMAEMPGLELLKEKHKDNADLAIVSLSIDNTDKIWLNNLEKRNPGGIQWRIDRTDLSDYEVATIPRYILIDKSFKIVDLDAPKPSDPELQKLLEGLVSTSR